MSQTQFLFQCYYKNQNLAKFFSLILCAMPRFTGTSVVGLLENHSKLLKKRLVNPFK